MTPLQIANVRRWLVALRSGKYRQGHHRLVTNFGKDDAEFCCLGVFCDVMQPDRWEAKYSGPVRSAEVVHLLGPSGGNISAWAWETQTGLPFEVEKRCIQLNDGTWAEEDLEASGLENPSVYFDYQFDFEDIARYLERELDTNRKE